MWPHFFFKVFLSETFTCPILGPLVLLFWVSNDVSSGFQSQNRFCLIHFCRGECNVHYLRFTPGATYCRSLDSQLCGVPRILSVSAEAGVGVEPKITGFYPDVLPTELLTLVYVAPYLVLTNDFIYRMFFF